jgi:hypothetical protein
MKNRYHAGGLLALAIMVGLVAISGVPWVNKATAQSPVTLTLYNPTGGFEVTQAFAPRLTDLNRKTICEVTNGSWEAARTFPAIRELLQKQFPTAKFVSFDKLPTVLTTSDIPNLEDSVKAAGCEAVIVGNAG